VTSPPGQTAVSANISIAVDDTFTLFVNGKMVGSARTTNPDWRIGYFFPDVPMDPSVNVFAISAINQPDPRIADGESTGNVLVGISMGYVDSEDASVSNIASVASSSIGGSTPSGTATGSTSVLKTVLPVRTISPLQSYIFNFFTSEELCHHRAHAVAHEHLNPNRFHPSFRFC
jgi:hypothetical protein